jgi:hypothetical protein
MDRLEYAEVRARAAERELVEVRRRYKHYAAELDRWQTIAGELSEWSERLAGALFLTLVDSLSHGAECSGVLRDYRDYVRDSAAIVHPSAKTVDAFIRDVLGGAV